MGQSERDVLYVALGNGFLSNPPLPYTLAALQVLCQRLHITVHWAAAVSSLAELKHPNHSYHHQHTIFVLPISSAQDRTTSLTSLSQYTVVLTTYGTLAMEAPPREKHTHGSSGGGSKKGAKGKTKGEPAAAAATGISQGQGHRVIEEWQPLRPGYGNGGMGSGFGGGRKGGAGGPTAGLLFQIHWHRVVLDEAQSIKNPRTLAAHAAWCLSAEHRWCLSGTPIQNSVRGCLG